MPFTFSHPAIVLPFKKYGSTTALIIGSIIPDIEGFFTAGLQKSFSHSILGAISFDLPAGIFLCYLYHGLVKNSLIDNLPLFLKERFHRFKTFNWKFFSVKHRITVILSLVVGIASHLGWDYLTHEHVIFTTNQNYHLPRTHYSILDICQFLFSILGLLFIIHCILKLPRAKTEITSGTIRYWIVVAISTILISKLITITQGNIDLNITTILNVVLGGMISGLLMGAIIQRSILFCKY